MNGHCLKCIKAWLHHCTTHLSEVMLDTCPVKLASVMSSSLRTCSWLRVKRAGGRCGRATSCSLEQPFASTLVIARSLSSPQRLSKLSSSSLLSLTGDKKTDRRWANKGSYWSNICKRKARSFLRSGTSLREHNSFREWKEYCLRELKKVQEKKEQNEKYCPLF